MGRMKHHVGKAIVVLGLALAAVLVALIGFLTLDRTTVRAADEQQASLSVQLREGQDIVEDMSPEEVAERIIVTLKVGEEETVLVMPPQSGTALEIRGETPWLEGEAVIG